MKRGKIAFVVVRYGAEINGGAEYHCKMLAERLVDDYDVEVLTTCVKDYVTGKNEYPEGEEVLNRVKVRRFKADPIDHDRFGRDRRRAKAARKLRRFLFRCHLLKFIAWFCPVWTYKQKEELQAIRNHVFYSSGLFQYIKDNKDAYKAFIPVTIDYPPMYYTLLYAAEKSIAIPTMHNEGSSFWAVLTSVFTKAAYIGFNTKSEQRLAENIFGRHLAPHGIISVSIENPFAADWKEAKARYQLPDEYLLFVGRVDPGKLHRLIQYFLAYKKKYDESRLKLVLVGGIFSKQTSHPDIIYTGFVSDGEKAVIIRHAKVVVNPSKYESLSLMLLEAMSMGRAMLVNGRCDVLKEHCKKSNRAAIYYLCQRDFISKLHLLDISYTLREKMGKRGKRYVKENYDWDIIMGRLKRVIKSLESSTRIGV
jgi:glycosyltransferase involved in cell wall biosynthesis